METLFAIFFISFIIMAILFAAMWSESRRPYVQGKMAISATTESLRSFHLDYAIVDPAGRMIGLRTKSRKIVIKPQDGAVIELDYDALRSVTLTPVMSSYSESFGEVSTRRGSQLIGAGVGAAVAGPLGALVGGLTGGQKQQSSTTTLSSTDDLELEMFFRDDDLPRFAMHAGSPNSLGGSVMNPELRERFKDMAARLANIVERRAS
jgi:hypothetical protein